MLAVRSKDRLASTSVSSSDFRIQLNQPIQGAYYLSHVLIPNTSYPVRADNNTLALMPEGGGLNILTITPGFYTGESLCVAVELAIRGATGDPNFAVTVSPVTARVTISRGNGNRFALLWAGLANSLAPVLGFDPAVSTDLAASHTGTELMDLTHSHLTFNVIVDAPGVSYGITNTRGHHASFMVSNEENSLDYISWDERTRFPQKILFRSPVRELHVSLVDSEFRPVDLNGAEWHMLWRPTC